MKASAVLSALVAVSIASSNAAAEVQDYVPVTEDMLTNPAPVSYTHLTLPTILLV